MKLKYFNTINGIPKLSTEIEADYKNQTVKIINYTDDLIFRAFGINEKPSWKDFNDFLISRCFPKERYNCKELLKLLGLQNVGYEPIEIIKKTEGRMAEDEMFILIED